MKKPERQFRQSIVRYIDRERVHCWSINDSYTAGVPDHWYSGYKADLWAEYKYFPKDVSRFDLTRPPKNPKLTRRQQLWLNGRWLEGRNVWVIVGMPSGGMILEDEEWMNPVESVVLLDRREIANQIMRICCGSSSNSGATIHP